MDVIYIYICLTYIDINPNFMVLFDYYIVHIVYTNKCSLHLYGIYEGGGGESELLKMRTSESVLSLQYKLKERKSEINTRVKIV